MLQLRASIPDELGDRFHALLREHGGVRRVMRQADEAAASAEVFVADVEPVAADPLVEAIAELGIGRDDFVLTKLDVVAPLRHLGGEHGGAAGFAWVEVVGQARANSRPLARYLALINVAAVIAASA